jgi:hypothetical protein
MRVYSGVCRKRESGEYAATPVKDSSSHIVQCIRGNPVIVCIHPRRCSKYTSSRSRLVLAETFIALGVLPFGKEHPGALALVMLRSLDR